MNAAEAFRTLIDSSSSQRPNQQSLLNVTFFVGAGFSKTWDVNSPTGNELFTFPKQFLADMAANIELDDLLDQPGYPTNDAAPSTFKELVYNLSMQLKYPGIRTRYMDEQSIVATLDEIKAIVQKRFESLTSINHFDHKSVQPKVGEQRERLGRAHHGRTARLARERAPKCEGRFGIEALAPRRLDELLHAACALGGSRSPDAVGARDRSQPAERAKERRNVRVAAVPCSSLL